MRYKRSAIASIGIDADAELIRSLLAENSERIPIPGSCTLICDDAISYLRKWRGGPETFIYCDPPYLRETRRSKERLYKYEFWSVDQHSQLLAILQKLPCMVAISGYWSPLYSEMLATWRAISFKAGVRCGQAATEWLWMNYPVPVALHDYRYLGRNYREREKLKRQRQRWRLRLERMNQLQRYMLMASLADLGDPGRRQSIETASPAEMIISPNLQVPHADEDHG